MSRAGVEPAHPTGRQILNLLCLPVPPPGRGARRGDRTHL